MTDNATIYLPCEPSELDWFTTLANVESSMVTQLMDDRPSQFTLKIANAVVTMNVMDPPTVPRHMAGFANYVLQVNQQKPRDSARNLLERLRTIKTVLGCIVEPGFDDEGCVVRFVYGIANKCGGLIFVKDSVFSSDGEPLIGPAVG